jgi:hypothetical protein
MTICAVAVLLCIAPKAMAADARASVVVKLFSAACIPNMGNPDGVRAWATAQRLSQIEAAAPLDVFVGPGGKGAAWAVPTPYGNFALSIRGTTQACAVWAQAAEPAEVERYFKTMIEGLKQLGINLRVDKDATHETAAGHAHTLVYNVIAPGAPSGYEFTMLAVERPNAAFQASIQVAKASTD